MDSSSGGVIRWRGKKVVSAVSGKRTSWAPSVEACRSRVRRRSMVSVRVEVRCTGPIWAAASLSVRGMVDVVVTRFEPDSR